MKKVAGATPLLVSAASGEGVPEVLRALAAEVERLRGKAKVAVRRAPAPGMASMKRNGRGAKRLVVKIGSSLLVDTRDRHAAKAWLEALADDIAAPARAGQEVIVVSSGAIALGRTCSGCPRAH